MFSASTCLNVWIVIGLVTANPLIQTIQPSQITNYQHNLYRQQYSDPFIFQPNNINPYSQQLLVHTPLSTYHALNVPSLSDRLHQIYWDKLKSNPNVQDIIDTKNNLHNQIVNEILKSYPNPYNTREVVNNYIIVPPDYIKINETDRDKKVKNKKNDSKDSKKEVALSQRRKKENNDNGSRKDANANNVKVRNKKERLEPKKNSLLTEGIKCYTPADVLDDGNSKTEKKKKKKVKNGSFQMAKKKKTENDSEDHLEIKKTKKPKKLKKKKSKNTPGSETSESGNEIKNKSTKKTKCIQNNQVFDDCKCDRKVDICKINEANTDDIVPPHCYQDLDELFNLNQDCVNLENRCTRNSKNDAAAKASRNMYPDLPDDMLKRFTSYMNDLFSNQQTPNSNLFSGNSMYPYDLNQVYQVLQYSNTEVNKSNGKKEKNRSSRRRKKPKKKTSKKTKKEEHGVNKNDSTTPKNNKQLKTTVEVTPISTTVTSIDTTVTNTLEPITTITPISSTITPITTTVIPVAATTTSIATTIIPIATGAELGEMNTPKNNEKSSTLTEISSTEPSTSVENLGLSKEPNRHVDVLKNLNAVDHNEVLQTTVTPQKELIETKNIYETQIPETITIEKIKKDEIETLQNEEKVYDELEYDERPLSAGLYFDQVPELGSEDEIVNIFDNRLLEDYYPDFRADNHAYLVSQEEIDFRNIHGRYFYTTDKNINSKETDQSSTDRTHVFKEKLVYAEGTAKSESIGNYNKNAGSNKKNDEPQKIVFRTPPGLDDPDFRTRKINRDSQDSREIYYQHSSYDDDFERFNMDSFADKSGHNYKTAEPNMKANDKSGSLVETVYARSKVVKYGQTEEQNNPKETKRFAAVDDGRIQYDGDKTIVIAKSLAPEEFW